METNVVKFSTNLTPKDGIGEIIRTTLEYTKIRVYISMRVDDRAKTWVISDIRTNPLYWHSNIPEHQNVLIHGVYDNPANALEMYDQVVAELEKDLVE